MKVFVIDDSVMMCVRLLHHLRDMPGIEVGGFAHNAANGIEGIHRSTPDLVILDIQMPGGNGIDVLKRIGSRAGVPIIIVLSNYSQPQYRNRCQALGAKYFFDKSVEFDDLIETVRRLAEEERGTHVSDSTQ